MDPNIWGPPTWFFYHTVPIECPDNPTPEHKANIKSFYTNFGSAVPCITCRINYNKHLHKYPLTDKILSSNILLFNWTVDIHNEVNKLNNKPVLTYQDSYNRLMKKYSKYQDAPNKKRLRYLLILVFIILIVVVVYKNKNL